mgnify:CR=1 FL=1
MQQYTYAQIETAEPYPGEDGSRVISFFVFNTDVHFHVYCGDGRERSEDEGAGRTVEALDDALRHAGIGASSLSAIYRGLDRIRISPAPMPPPPIRSMSRPRRPSLCAWLAGTAREAGAALTSPWGR